MHTKGGLNGLGGPSLRGVWMQMFADTWLYFIHTFSEGKDTPVTRTVCEMQCACDRICTVLLQRERCPVGQRRMVSS